LVFDKSPHAIISMIGSWKAGFAYVPINPESVKAQFVRVLEDSQISIILVHSTTEAHVRGLLSGTQFVLSILIYLFLDLPTNSKYRNTIECTCGQYRWSSFSRVY
jgi:acyl-CoA synthetase (AMP-forming)/AMP-acid ligase II